MVMKEVGFSYKIEEFGVMNMEVLEGEDDFIIETIRDTYPDVTDINIDYVRDIK